MFFMYRKVSRRYNPSPPKGPLSWVSHDCARSMLLVSQLKLPSRSYRAIGWGFSKGDFLRGGQISIIGVGARTGC